MATTKLYKLDNGNSYATNCFPARNILRTSEEGAGHWLVSHKAAQKTKFEAVICAKSLQDEVGGTLQYLAELQHHGYMDEMVQENILDGPFLIKLHCVKIPSDLCSVDISNKNLVSAKEDDFEQFDSVAYINATENLLTLEAFRTFSGLRELELSLNGLRNLKISAGDFLHLEILDLSYNNLSPEDVRRLGVLSQLKVLHLTANGLRSLPSDLAVSENDSPSCLRFPSLEVLLLDDNDLSHPSVFVSLANLRSLKQLNLDKNGIAEVPYLHQMENSQFSLHPQSAKMGTKAEPCSFPSRFGQKHEQPLQAGAGLQGQLVTEKEQLEYLILQNHQDPDRTEVVFTSVSREPPLLDVFMEGNDHSCLADSGTLPASSRNTLSQEFMPPLPELRYLSLANNKLDDADDIPSSVWRHELEERQGKRKHKPRTSGSCTYIPTKYKGYEELLRVKTDPEFIEPVGMQQNVQALRRALKQPLVYRDSKARLDSVQKPYVPRKKKMGRPPGPPSQKTKAEALEDILLAMRGNMNIIEVPLVSVLQKKKSNRKEYQEALGLMKEFHKKYKAALATSNKAICKESVNIPALGQSPTQETFVEIEESKSDSLPQDTDESESLKHYLSLEKSSSRKRSVVTFAL
ncbi:X-ray radiation resistance-associated protein 1 isoform X2 [Trachemys scripta elegans]|uniref:X-ray radiation resistance-associated protein 1 isoform X2 n=1 Tax=Trachemys scripta elegans TaxID=31138 RepID=UPI001554041A|nr:X-ray radiation resistance-associated protein 1 isoform X2 [Trachemys scripta elegans]